jgi:hypothetical protein
VSALRLLDPGSGSINHEGEVLACAYTRDNAFVLSAGWDGHLRLWDNATRSPVVAFRAGKKPISACAISPDGTRWISGSMEGFLCYWDASKHLLMSTFLAHGRPISAIAFGTDEHIVATASWDSSVVLWDVSRERKSRTLAGHGDVVAGCRFTPEGKFLLSWSYDSTLRLWDLGRNQCLSKLDRHTDRITAADVSPDGRWAVSGSRDRALKLWDLQARKEVGTISLETEIRACFFLRDGQSLIAIDAHGRLSLHAVPDLGTSAELSTSLPIQCAELSPAGDRIALGCTSGQLHFVALEGFESAPLVVAAARNSRRSASPLQRLFGKSTVIDFFTCACPVCRRSFELPNADSDRPLPCPSCQRHLRVLHFA